MTTRPAGRKRVAIYCRVSSAGQEDNSSLATQEQSCRSYAADQRWDVVAVYCDVHSGAELFQRAKLTILREDMKAGEFDILLVHALDRLSRDQTHLGFILTEARHAGVEWDSATEDIDHSPLGQMIQAIVGGMAALERLKISERTVRGRIDRVKNGKLIPGGKPLYGYQWKDETKGRLVPDPETAPIVQRIYGELARGKTLSKIAADLTGDRIPTPTGRGSVWHASTLSTILHKPAYKGEAYGWGLRKAGARPQHFDPEKAIRLPDGTIPPLVDEVTWEAAKRILQRNQERSIRSAKHPEMALLRGGFIRCGYCGRAAKTRPRGDGQGADYYCNPSGGFGCKGPSIKASILDMAVWDRTRAILTDPNLIAREVERLRRTDSTGEDLRIVATQLADIERQRTNISRAIAMIEDADALCPLVNQLTDLAERDKALRAMKAEIERRRETWEAARTNLDQLNKWCATVATNVDELTWEQKRLALDALGFSVTLFRTDHEPRFVITATVDQHSAFSTT